MNIILKSLTLVSFVSSLALASTTYPVDSEINDLRGKANYLESFKNYLLKHKCFMEVGQNKLQLTAGELRSQGLVIGIADRMPGNYYAFHKAPKPKFLARVMSDPSAQVIGAQLWEKGLRSFVATPHEVAGVEDFWIYLKDHVRVETPSGGGQTKSTTTTKSGKTVTLTCE